MSEMPSAQDHLTSAEACINAGDYRQAIVEAKQAIQLDPTAAFAFVICGVAHYQLDEDEQAFKDFSEAIRLAPGKYPAAYANRGMAYMLQNKLAEAVNDATEALRINPAHPTALHVRSRSFFKQGNFAQAVADATALIEARPECPEGYNLRSEALEALGDIARALADAERAVELDPENPLYLWTLAKLGLAGGDLDGAIANATRAIEAAPEPADAYATRAYATRADAHRLKGDYAQAIADATAAIKQDPDNVNVHALGTRAMAHLLNHDPNLALDDADEALRLDPNHAFAHGTRAEACRVLKKYDEALPAANRAVALLDHWSSYQIRGRIKRLLADFDGAVADLSRAQRDNPGDANIAEELALARHRDASEPFRVKAIHGTDPRELETPETKAFLFRARVRMFLGQPVVVDKRAVQEARGIVERYAENRLDEATRKALRPAQAEIEKMLPKLRGEERGYVAELDSLVKTILDPSGNA